MYVFSLTGCLLFDLYAVLGLLGYAWISLDSAAILLTDDGAGLVGYALDSHDNTAILPFQGVVCLNGDMWVLVGIIVNVLLLLGPRVGALLRRHAAHIKPQTRSCTAVLREKGRACGLGKGGCAGALAGSTPPTGPPKGTPKPEGE